MCVGGGDGPVPARAGPPHRVCPGIRRLIRLVLHSVRGGGRVQQDRRVVRGRLLLRHRHRHVLLRVGLLTVRDSPCLRVHGCVCERVGGRAVTVARCRRRQLKRQLGIPVRAVSLRARSDTLHTSCTTTCV